MILRRSKVHAPSTARKVSIRTRRSVAVNANIVPRRMRATPRRMHLRPHRHAPGVRDYSRLRTDDAGAHVKRSVGPMSERSAYRPNRGRRRHTDYELRGAHDEQDGAATRRRRVVHPRGRRRQQPRQARWSRQRLSSSCCTRRVRNSHPTRMPYRRAGMQRPRSQRAVSASALLTRGGQHGSGG